MSEYFQLSKDLVSSYVIITYFKLIFQCKDVEVPIISTFQDCVLEVVHISYMLQ